MDSAPNAAGTRKSLNTQKKKRKKKKKKGKQKTEIGGERGNVPLKKSPSAEDLVQPKGGGETKKSSGDLMQKREGGELEELGAKESVLRKGRLGGEKVIFHALGERPQGSK